MCREQIEIFQKNKNPGDNILEFYRVLVHALFCKSKKNLIFSRVNLVYELPKDL